MRAFRRIQRFTSPMAADIVTVHADTVTSLIVKDADGAKGVAEVLCDGLRPSCLWANDDQLRMACVELQLKLAVSAAPCAPL